MSKGIVKYGVTCIFVRKLLLSSYVRNHTATPGTFSEAIWRWRREWPSWRL